jgi:hypothetical protein
MNDSLDCALSVGYTENNLEGTVSTKFLGLQIHNQPNWKNHIDQIIPNLSGVCYAVMLMFHISNMRSLNSIYFACQYVFSVMIFTVHNQEISKTNSPLYGINTRN